MKKLIPKDQITREPKKTEGAKHTLARTPDAAVKIPPQIRNPAVAKQLCQILTDEDLESVAEVFRESLTATRRFWHSRGKDAKGKEQGEWVIEPDYKTRLSAAQAIAANKEGLPIQRQVTLQAKFHSMDETKARLSSSPEMLKALAGLRSAGFEVVSDGQVIDVETVVQKSGSDSEPVASEE